MVPTVGVALLTDALNAACAPATMVKLCETCVAALKLALPAWLALIVQVPRVKRLSVPPLVILQTDAVAEATLKLTVKFELALAVNTGLVPNALLPGFANAIV